MARSLNVSSNESINVTIEGNNIGKKPNDNNNNTDCVYSVVIDVKLPTEEELMTIDDVVFPEGAKITNNNLINEALVIIPSSIILHQFKIKGICIPVHVNRLHSLLTVHSLNTYITNGKCNVAMCIAASRTHICISTHARTQTVSNTLVSSH